MAWAPLRSPPLRALLPLTQRSRLRHPTCRDPLGRVYQSLGELQPALAAVLGEAPAFAAEQQCPFAYLLQLLQWGAPPSARLPRTCILEADDGSRMLDLAAVHAAGCYPEAWPVPLALQAVQATNAQQQQEQQQQQRRQQQQQQQQRPRQQQPGAPAATPAHRPAAAGQQGPRALPSQGWMQQPDGWWCASLNRSAVDRSKTLQLGMNREWSARVRALAGVGSAGRAVWAGRAAYMPCSRPATVPLTKLHAGRPPPPACCCRCSLRV